MEYDTKGGNAVQQIYPINEKTIAPCIGQPICAVLYDGTPLYGICGGISGGQLMFSNAYGAGVLSTKAEKAKEQLVKLKDKANTSAWGLGLGLFGLGLGLIALLFLLPFFFI